MIDGMIYHDNFISKEEEIDLVECIDKQSWNNSLSRKTQHYGYRYDYTKKTVDSFMYLGAVPQFISCLNDRLSTWFDSEPNQVIVNQYQPGQGIGRHIDRDCFGPVVASISLLSSVTMDLSRYDSDAIDSIVLQPRSILILAREARYDWMHGIAARKYDINSDGTKICRTRRISLTFRTVTTQR